MDTAEFFQSTASPEGYTVSFVLFMPGSMNTSASLDNTGTYTKFLKR